MNINISQAITRGLVRDEIIPESDAEICEYGIRQWLRVLLNLLTTFLIGLAFGLAAEMLVYISAFIPLRSNAGGYHSKTPERCLCLSVILVTSVAAVIKLVPLSVAPNCFLALLSAAVILILAPIEDGNKPFDELERRVFRHRATSVLAAELILCGLLSSFGHNGICSAVAMAMSTEAALLAFGAKSNRSINIVGEE